MKYKICLSRHTLSRQGTDYPWNPGWLRQFQQGHNKFFKGYGTGPYAFLKRGHGNFWSRKLIVHSLILPETSGGPLENYSQLLNERYIRNSKNLTPALKSSKQIFQHALRVKANLLSVGTGKLHRAENRKGDSKSHSRVPNKRGVPIASRGSKYSRKLFDYNHLLTFSRSP